jgi:hypothetical protein
MLAPIYDQKGRKIGEVHSTGSKIGRLGALFSFGFILFGISLFFDWAGERIHGIKHATISSPAAIRPQQTTQGQVHTCPPFLQNLSKCWVIDLPGNGEWVRWRNPTTAALTIPDVSGVAARGCGGEIYDLAKLGQTINSSCGYIDYRGTDGWPHIMYVGVR